MTSNSSAIPQDGTFIAMNDTTLNMAATSLPTRIEIPPNSGMMAGGIGYFPPKSENLDEIITVPVTVPERTTPFESQPLSAETDKKHSGFMGRLAGLMGSNKDKERGEEAHLRVVYMPRREYLKYFARDAKRNYIGSEPEKKSWTDEELDDMFKQYEPAAVPKAKGTLADKLLTPLGGGLSW